MTAPTPTPGELSHDHLIQVLMTQHARIRKLMDDVEQSQGSAREKAFGELRELLAVHEAGEEVVLRALSAKTAGQEVADARNREEDKAAQALADLEQLDVGSDRFAEMFAQLKEDVSAHAEAEERDEFPAVRAALDTAELERLGAKLLRAEEKAPTHPHPGAAGSPTAQRVLGPFAALVDSARDRLKS